MGFGPRTGAGGVMREHRENRNQRGSGSRANNEEYQERKREKKAERAAKRDEKARTKKKWYE
jgi:hypothetical protein